MYTHLFIKREVQVVIKTYREFSLVSSSFLNFSCKVNFLPFLTLLLLFIINTAYYFLLYGVSVVVDQWWRLLMSFHIFSCPIISWAGQFSACLAIISWQILSCAPSVLQKNGKKKVAERQVDTYKKIIKLSWRSFLFIAGNMGTHYTFFIIMRLGFMVKTQTVRSKYV